MSDHCNTENCRHHSTCTGPMGGWDDVTLAEAMADADHELRRPKRRHDPESVRRAFGDDPPW